MTSAGETTVDIVIPVHRRERPILRAVKSVLAAQHEAVRALVVCHNIGADEIGAELVSAELGDLTEHPRVRLLELRDGIPSPAGPLNCGLRHSEADYVGFLGSDDEFEPGVLDAWVGELSGSPDLLIGQLSSDGAGRIMAPAPRIGRFAGLDPVADLLNYRTAPVGLLARREFIAESGVRGGGSGDAGSGPSSGGRGPSPGFREGFRVGEDIALGLFLWNYAGDIRYSRCASGYLIREDGPDRVTGVPLPPAEILAPVRDAVGLPVIRALSRRRRQAIAVKLLRHQVLELLKAKHRAGILDEALLTVAADTAEELLAFAPGAGGFFNVPDARMLRAVRDRVLGDFVAAVERAENLPYQRKLVSVNPLHTLAPESFYVRARRTRLVPQHLRPAAS